MTVIVAVAASIVFYQVFYLPESLLKPSVDEHILHPEGQTEVSMIPGALDPAQENNFVPKLLNLQLGIDNHVIWSNDDETGHTVTPDHATEDSYSGAFGSDGIIMPGETYEFLFTEEMDLKYFCIPHPWMTGEIVITKQRF